VTDIEIPLFPLHSVLCPGIALPLHVFEPRYRLMAERCVADETPFGIVLIREGREVGGDEVAIAGIGTFAEIRKAGRHPDGRYDLLVVGAGRFAIEDVDPDREPYLVATVTPLEDEVGNGTRAARLASRSMRRFVGYLQLLQPQDGESADEIDVQIEVESEIDDDEAAEGEEVVSEIELRQVIDPFAPGDPVVGTGGGEDTDEDGGPSADDGTTSRLIIPDDPTTLSYLLSGIIQVDPMQRQLLLEAETTEDRLVALDALLDRELWMLRRRLRVYTPDMTHAAVRRN
jgi:Lon protease-like protein